MPLNDERPSSGSSSSAGDQASDGEGSSGRYDSVTSASEQDFSRRSFTSDGSSKQSSPSSSPPKTITLDEVMASANDLFNLRLAHEIIVNRDFSVEQPDLPDNSLWKRVRDMVHKAFWDSLESELNSSPPVYDHAIKLLEEIREILLSFLNPGANRLRTQILEVLDMELVRQQAGQHAVDVAGLASYVITTMGKLCAPARDQDIQRLHDSTDGNMVAMFREIFRVLDLMKMDMVNYTIHSLRPELQRHSVEYEQAKFQAILDNTPSALDHTTAWIQGSLEELLQDTPPGGQGKGARPLPSPQQVLRTAFIRILTWDYHNSPLPETLVTDEQRVRDMKLCLQRLQAVAAVLLIVHSAVGEPIRALPSLAHTLKRMTSALLEGMHKPEFSLEEALECVGVQVCGELQRSLAEGGFPALPPALQATLRGQILGLAQDQDPVRSLVAERVQQYFAALLSAPAPGAPPPPMPAGLTAVQPELSALGAAFAALVNFNLKVYTPFYLGILKRLLFSSAPPTAQDPAHTPSAQDPAHTPSAPS